MRRRHRLTDDLPEHLATFREHDWPGDTTRERYECWADACRLHMDAHGWPGGAVEMFVLFHDTRLRLSGRPPPPSRRKFMARPGDS